MSLTSSPPSAAVASNISPWMRQARSQLGSRLAVASSAKISRPRPPDGRGGGARCRSRRKASTSAETSPGFAGVGSRLSSLIVNHPRSRRPQPDRGVVKHRAAARQSGIGAGQEIDADPLLKGVVWPQPLDDDDATLHPVERAGVDDDTALRIADADALAVGDAERGERDGMDERGRPPFAGDARWHIVKAGVEKRARRRRHQAERPLGIPIIDNRDMVGEGRQQRFLRTERAPIGAEVELPVAMAEAVEEMPGFEA